MEIRGIRIIEMFNIANTLKKCNRAIISYATPIFSILVLNDWQA